MESLFSQFGTINTDLCNAVAVDSTDNIIIAGYTTNALDDGKTNTGGFDAFIRKYDSDGNILFTKQLGTPSNEYWWHDYRQSR